MNAVENIVLILSVVGVLTLGYFLVTKIDKLLGPGRRSIEKETEKRDPACVMFTEDATTEEIATEVQKFRKDRGKSRVIIYSATELSEDISIDDDSAG